jgi:hypothetical protein
MIRTTITIDDEALPLLGTIRAMMGPEGMKQANQAGARGAVVAARKFHREFDAAGGWRGPNSYGAGKSAFGAAVAGGWDWREAESTGVTIFNPAEHYAFKVRGGRIVPKRVRYLTIPLIREAKDRRARDYEIDFNTRLFRPNGKDVLMERTGPGKARAVYALKKSITQRPWPDAVPPDGIIIDGFAEGVEEWLDAELEKP